VLFTEPAYQRGLPEATQRLLAGHRGLPDVALDASSHSPVLIYVGGRWGLAAGTSVAAPMWAGLLALADSDAGHDLGWIAPALYKLATTSRYHLDWHDIITGISVGPGPGGAHLTGVGLAAGPGWDAVTGLGSPQGAALLADLAAPAAR
jgi:subtilase family serine protease